MSLLFTLGRSVLDLIQLNPLELPNFPAVSLLEGEHRISCLEICYSKYMSYVSKNENDVLKSSFEKSVLIRTASTSIVVHLIPFPEISI